MVRAGRVLRWKKVQSRQRKEDENRAGVRRWRKWWYFPEVDAFPVGSPSHQRCSSYRTHTEVIERLEA